MLLASNRTGEMQLYTFRFRDGQMVQLTEEQNVVPFSSVLDPVQHRVYYFAGRTLKCVAAVPWSPPAWMKDNGSAVKGGHVRPEHYDDLALYLKTWVERYTKEYGLNIRWLSIQNEPSNATDYASAVCSFQELNEVAVRVADAFEEAGLSTLIGAPEATTLATTMNFMNSMSREALEKLDYIPTHFYDLAPGDLERYDLRKFSKPLLMTEVCDACGTRQRAVMPSAAPSCISVIL
ncbi:O-Glycosyl hydrolase family 30 [Paenibacillus sp. 1_12]|nr:O-Glycosyl hydrolase family 30 [Paenibacillus sp. 1_12]